MRVDRHPSFRWADLGSSPVNLVPSVFSITHWSCRTLDLGTRLDILAQSGIAVAWSVSFSRPGSRGCSSREILIVLYHIRPQPVSGTVRVHFRSHSTIFQLEPTPLHSTNAETDRDRLRLEAVQAGDEIRDLQAQISNLERETDDARTESATALASYNRISSSLTRSPSDRGRDPSPSRSARLVQTQRDHALVDLALAQANLTQVTSDRDRAFKQLARATKDRDRAPSNRDSALRLRDLAVTARDQARLDLLTETARTAQLDDDLEVVRLELQEREREMSDLQVAHDQLTVLRDLAESDLIEDDLFLTHLASRIRESQATRMPKRERSPRTSPPQLPPSKTPRSDRPVSPPRHQDLSEIEVLDDQEHQDQHEFEGGDDQEHRDPSEIEGEDDQEHEDLHEFESEGDQEHKDQHEFEGPDDQDHRDQSEIESQEDQEHKDHDEFEDSDDQDLEDKHEIPSGGGGSPGDHDSPPPDHGPTTPPPSPPSGHHPTTPPPSPPQSPGGSPGGGSPGGGSPIQLNPLLFPAEASVPHYSLHGGRDQPLGPTRRGTCADPGHDPSYSDEADADSS